MIKNIVVRRTNRQYSVLEEECRKNICERRKSLAYTNVN